MSTRTAAPLTIGRKRMALSNPDKVLYPEAGFTKKDVLDYYLRIAPVMLPHLANRPLTLKRYPNGVEGQFFYEKRCPQYRPDWVKTAAVYSSRNDGEINYCLCNDAATLAWLANLACLEFHPLLSKSKNSDKPTLMVFDLDPGPPAGLLDCVDVALHMRETLGRLGLQAFPKTSGSKGIHMWVPLNTPVTFDQTKQFAHALTMILEKESPKTITSLMKKELRPGKVFIDWSQNDSHKTTAAPYTLRARPQPTVSTPLMWSELERAAKKKDASDLQFTAPQVLERVEEHGDLFEPVLKLKQKLPHMNA